MNQKSGKEGGDGILDEYREPKYNEETGNWEYKMTRIDRSTGEEVSFTIVGESKFIVTIRLIKYLEYRSYKLLESSKDFDQDYNK
jgi:hypothetical protein